MYREELIEYIHLATEALNKIEIYLWHYSLI